MDKTKADEELNLSSDPPTGDRMIGVTVGQHFKIERHIGSGARGRVYVAYHEVLEQHVAVKVLLEETDDEHLTRFKQEASALLGLRHSNIVCVREYGYHDYRPYLVMDFVDGKSLAEMLTHGGRLSDTLARSVFIQAVAALQHAHENGVLHRDIKPANIMICPKPDGDCHVYIVDFGLAKAYAPDGRSLSGLTQTGMLVGTPQYMSPEQCTGADLDPRADIYSLGCVMYEAVTGVQCYSSDSLFDCLYRQINELPRGFDDIESAEPIRSSLEDTIFRCLSKDKEERFQTAQELLLHLQSTTIRGVDARENSPWWRRMRPKRKRQKNTVVVATNQPTLRVSVKALPVRIVGAMIDSVIYSWLGIAALGAAHLAAMAFLLEAGLHDRLPAMRGLFPMALADWFFSGWLVLSYILYRSSVMDINVGSRPQLLYALAMVAGIYVYSAGMWVYRAIYEGSRLQATPGKLMAGLVLTDKNGMRITFIRSLMRSLVRPFTMLLVPDLVRFLFLGPSLGWSAALKQCLTVPFHDWVSGVQVRQLDMGSAKFEVKAPMPAAAAAAIFGLAAFIFPLSNMSWMAALFATWLVIISWFVCVHRLFAIAHHKDNTIINPWLASVLNAVVLAPFTMFFIMSIFLISYMQPVMPLPLFLPAAILPFAALINVFLFSQLVRAVPNAPPLWRWIPLGLTAIMFLPAVWALVFYPMRSPLYVLNIAYPICFKILNDLSTRLAQRLR